MFAFCFIDNLIDCFQYSLTVGKGGKNYKKGKKRDEGETRRDLLFKEDGQGDYKS